MSAFEQPSDRQKSDKLPGPVIEATEVDDMLVLRQVGTDNYLASDMYIRLAKCQ